MHSFVIYIDEAGDEGFRFDEGSSSWFILSAVITRREHDLETVKLIDSVRARLTKAPRSKNQALHFRNLRHQKRLVFVDEISKAPLRTVNILLHKPSLREVEKFKERFRLYFYCTRLLLERASWLCRAERLPSDAGDGSAKIYFSNRSSMSYEELRNYLRRLEEQAAVPNSDIRIEWDVIKPKQIVAKSAHRMMGLQIADAVASGFFAAVEPSPHGFTEGRYAEMMQPIVYKNKGKYLGYGVKLWPGEAEELAKISQLHAWYSTYKT